MSAWTRRRSPAHLFEELLPRGVGLEGELQLCVHRGDAHVDLHATKPPNMLGSKWRRVTASRFCVSGGCETPRGMCGLFINHNCLLSNQTLDHPWKAPQGCTDADSNVTTATGRQAEFSPAGRAREVAQQRATGDKRSPSSSEPPRGSCGAAACRPS